MINLSDDENELYASLRQVSPSTRILLLDESNSSLVTESHHGHTHK